MNSLRLIWPSRIRGFDVKAAAPYLLLILGAVGLVTGVWTNVHWKIQDENRYLASRSTERALSAVKSFEQYALRTLQAADNIIQVAIVSMKHNDPHVMIARTKETGVIDGTTFHSLNVQDKHGNLVASTLDVSKRINYADREYFISALSGTADEILIGTPVVSRLNGELVVPVARRFNDQSGSFAGLVLVQVNATAFASGYVDLGLQALDYAALVGLDGTVRAGKVGQKSIHGQVASSSNVIKRQRLEENGFFVATAQSDSVLRYVAYRTLKDYPLIVSFGVDARAASTRVLHYRMTLLTVGAGITLLVVFFTTVMLILVSKKDAANEKLRSNETKLRSLASTDFLTGIWNRAALNQFVEQIARNSDGAQNHACIFFDLDGFGEVNDALGHTVGDDVLKASRKQ